MSFNLRVNVLEQVLLQEYNMMYQTFELVYHQLLISAWVKQFDHDLPSGDPKRTVYVFFASDSVRGTIYYWVVTKTGIPIFPNIQNCSPLWTLVSRVKVVPNRDITRCPVHAETSATIFNNLSISKLKTFYSENYFHSVISSFSSVRSNFLMNIGFDE